jgi:hypothetical protein
MTFHSESKILGQYTLSDSEFSRRWRLHGKHCCLGCHSIAIFYLLCALAGLVQKPQPPCRAGATLWGGVARALANRHGLILQGERGIRPDFERCGFLGRR